MNIKGKKVTLRAIERDDLPLLQNWANDPETCLLIGSWHFPTNMNDQNKWFETLNVNSLNQRFAIDSSEHGLIGTANLININWKDRNAMHGMLLGNKDTKGKGYAMDAIMATMRYSFEEMGLNRLDGSIIEYNRASYELYVRKCGWKQEGTQRGWYFRKNRFWDKYLMGITKSDYEELVAQNKYWDE